MEKHFNDEETDFIHNLSMKIGLEITDKIIKYCGNDASKTLNMMLIASSEILAGAIWAAIRNLEDYSMRFPLLKQSNEFIEELIQNNIKKGD